jgi:UDP-N-acetylmuramoyl-L-alanyl-D-glutamate--2,6-diaminopimelate ligase
MRPLHCEIGVSLRQLIPESVILYAGDVRVTSCTSDARAVQPGDVYVALDTADSDGHDLLQVAIKRGARAAVVERALPQTRIPLCLVPDTRRAFGRLCQALAGDPSEHLSCIGVTGTDGKSVTSRLIGSVLREGGGAVGVLDDLTRESSSGGNLHPDRPCSASELAAALGEMSANHATHAVLEVSSRALAEQALAGLRFDAACFTNLTRAHLDLHNSVRSYHRVKRRLLTHLRAGGICVLNVDDAACAKLAAYAPGPVITCSLRGSADVTGEIIEQSPSEQSFLICVKNETVVVRTRYTGEQHVQNCLVAAAAGLAAGLDLAAIARGIERVEHLPGRLERASGAVSPRVYLDCCPTPTALAAALAALRDGKDGRVWYVSDVPRTSDDDELARFGHVTGRLADAAIIVTPGEDDTDQERRLGQMISGFGSVERAMTCRTRAQAIERAIRMADARDVVLIAADAVRRQKDQQTVRDALNARSRRQRVHLCSNRG